MEMNGQCSKDRCGPKIDCIEGHPNRSDCEFWAVMSGATPAVTMAPDADRVPWNGGSLVAQDINLISTQRRPHVVALLGPHDAGKTTYLAALHLLCCRGLLSQDQTFAGSLTLLGWERIVRSMRYPTPENPSPGYPPHTSSSVERQPGMLHYCFRGTDGNKRDILFTDAPGEWFVNWANAPCDAVSEGAKWTVDNANSFLLFVDRDALASKDLGIARAQIESISSRLGECLGARSIGIIWAKSDIALASQIEESIQSTLMTSLPAAAQFHTTVTPKGGAKEELIDPLKESFQFAIKPVEPRLQTNASIASAQPHDRFLAYRGLKQ